MPKDPRRRVLIEILPDRAVAVLPERAPRHEWAIAAATSAGILGLHALFIGWIIYGQRFPPTRGEIPPLLLVTVRNVIADGPRFPRPSAPPMATLPTLAEVAPRLAQVAPLREAIEASPPANGAQIVRVCGALLQQLARNREPASTTSLLVRVEVDGRVSDSQSGDEPDALPIDDSARDCIRAHVVLAPTRIDGAPAASWQRVAWLTAAVVRGH